MKTKTPAVWIVMLAAAFGVGAVMVYVRSTPHLQPREERPPTPPPVVTYNHEVKPEAKQGNTVTIYLPKMGPEGISFTKDDQPVPEGEDPKVFALNTFLRESEIAPDDAKVLDVDMGDDGLARVDCNKAFQQTYGSFDEKKMLDGLASILGQFPDVKTLVLEVENVPLKTLGSADLTDPIPVIRPDAVPMKPSFSAPPASDNSTPAKP